MSYSKYRTSYELDGQAGTKWITVEAEDMSHARSLVEAQTGSTDIQPFEKLSSNGNTNSSSSSYDIPLPSFGTIVKSLAVGSVILWGLQFVPSVDTNQPAREGTLMERIQQRNDTIIQYSNHHIDDTIPEFFNTELQEDVVDGLGQDWDN